MGITSVANALKGNTNSFDKIEVQGWIRTRRDSKAGFSFINLYDGSCFHPIQLVVPNTLENYSSEVLKVTAGCAIKATGELVESPGKGQAYEIQVDSIEVIGWIDDPETYPIQPKHHSMEYLREVGHLRPRTNVIGATTRLRHSAMMAIHQFFNDNGFFWVNTPIITASDCEGAGEMFRVSTLDMMNPPKDDNGNIDFKQDFFGKESFLTVSGQLNVESYCLALSKVYTFGPTFRAENSNTSRHLAEFWMVEPEVAFADLNDIATLSEQMLKHVCYHVLENCQDDMAFFEQRIEKTVIQRLEQLVESRFARVDYSDAITLLQQAKIKFEYPIHWGADLQTEHERFLAEEHFKAPVIVQNYPKNIKAFYMRINDDNKTVAAMDVLAPGIGEIIGGSQREERLAIFDARLAELKLDPADYHWYRDLRRYGSVPHAGFGLGFERLLSYLTGLANVRDVIPFPRTPNNISF